MKIAFLDRDGVINKEVNYLHKIEDYEYTYNCKTALKKILNAGFEIIIITNQAGIAKGIFTVKDYEKLTNYYRNDLLKDGIKILDILFCPHHPSGSIKKYTKDCNFRKPNPGMIKNILKKYFIDLNKSILIGDKISDIEAGMNAGIKNLYLVESGHKIEPKDKYRYKTFKNLYDFSNSFVP